MMAIVDILIYVAFAFFASYLARKSDEDIEANDISQLKWDKYLCWFIAFFTIIGGLRWNVGSDCISYALTFDHYEIDSSNKEILWKSVIRLFRALGLHWMFGLAFYAFIQIFFITDALKPYRKLLIFLPFVFFGGRYWMDTMGAVRQMTVACGFLWASRFIFERKFLYYAVFIIVGAMIHQSALLLIPFYFIPNNLQLEDKRWLLTGVLLVCVLIGKSAALQGVAGYVDIIAGATNYDDKIEELNVLMTSGQTNEALSFGPMMLTYLLIPIFIIWYGPQIKDEYGETVPYFSLWYNLAYIYACGYFLVCNVSHYLIRPMMYFSLFQMVMATMVLRYLWTRFKEYGIGQVACYLFCMVIFTNTAWDVYKAANSGRILENSTYKISLFHDDQKKWFRL